MKLGSSVAIALLAVVNVEAFVIPARQVETVSEVLAWRTLTTRPTFDTTFQIDGDIELTV